jgi:hypothetical protein
LSISTPWIIDLRSEMMTSMGPAFTGHPGAMQQHPGVPGHPMAPGMAQHPSQQGAPGGAMQHQLAAHMGVSQPGAQMNVMAGMPPGAGGPNAHAMQHLNPQAQMFPQQQFANCTYICPTMLSWYSRYHPAWFPKIGQSIFCILNIVY